MKPLDLRVCGTSERDTTVEDRLRDIKLIESARRIVGGKRGSMTKITLMSKMIIKQNLEKEIGVYEDLLGGHKKERYDRKLYSSNNSLSRNEVVAKIEILTGLLDAAKKEVAEYVDKRRIRRGRG